MPTRRCDMSHRRRNSSLTAWVIPRSCTFPFWLPKIGSLDHGIRRRLIFSLEVFEVEDLCQLVYDRLSWRRKLGAALMKFSRIHAKWSWKSLQQECAYVEEAAEVVYPVCYSIHNPMLYTLWINNTLHHETATCHATATYSSLRSLLFSAYIEPSHNDVVSTA